MSDSMKRVLIIDDDEQLRALLHEILERAGFAVMEAANGSEGLKLFRTDPADLVITDLIMPEKEGVETILELRREFPDARVIAISGGGRNGSASYLPIAARLGARRTVAKPFSRQEILEAVRDALGT
jgi:DNA-binding NtrC family response regulator